MSSNGFQKDHLIDHYITMGRYEQVLDLLSEGLSHNPQNARYHYQIGFIYMHLDRFSEAEEHVKMAFEYGYPKEDVYTLFGHLYCEWERWPEAEAAFLQALHENAYNAETYVQYAAMLVRVGHRDRGLQLIAEAERLNPMHPEVLRYRMYDQLAKNNDNGRIISMERYLKQSSSEYNSLMQLGIMEFYQGNFKAAREHFRQAYLLNPTENGVLHNLRLAEYKASPLLFPFIIAEKIGGISFFFFYIALSLLIIYPFQTNYLNQIMIGLGVFLAYLYLAHFIVLNMQRARDEDQSYVSYFLKSRNMLQAYLILFAAVASLLLHVPALFIFVVIITRVMKRGG